MSDSFIYRVHMSASLPVQTSDFIEDSIINLLPKITTSFYSVEYEPLLFKFNIASEYLIQRFKKSS